MDILHGQDGRRADDMFDYEAIESPPSVAQNERRLHVRAYNHWASLLYGRPLPSINDLNPDELPGFAEQSVLLNLRNFTAHGGSPSVIYLGAALREECGIDGRVKELDQIPPSSLLARLTEHYLEVIARGAPISFDSFFENRHGAKVECRGILMPYTARETSIDFVYGVMSWREEAEGSVADQIGREIAQIGDTDDQPAATTDDTAKLWTDAPLSDEPGDRKANIMANENEPRIQPDAEAEFDLDEILAELECADDEFLLSADMIASEAEADKGDTDATAERLPADQEAQEQAGAEFRDAWDDDAIAIGEMAGDTDLPDSSPDNSTVPDDLETVGDFVDADETGDYDMAADLAGFDEIAADEPDAEPAEPLTPEAPIPMVADGHDPGLDARLDMARASAREAVQADVRSRTALYRAIGDAYDFALAARDARDEYAVLIEAQGIVVQARAPMTAVVKLVFGADYDKTRIAEIATALDFALTQDMPAGCLADHLTHYHGGLKGLVADMRAARRAGEKKPSRRIETARRKLAKAAPITIAELPVDADGMAVAVVRRETDGTLTIMGALGTDTKAAQQAIIEASRTTR